MFSNLTVGIILGIGFGGWVYGKMQRSTGGNTQNSLVGGVLSGLLAMLIVTSLLSIFL